MEYQLKKKKHCNSRVKLLITTVPIANSTNGKLVIEIKEIQFLNFNLLGELVSNFKNPIWVTQIATKITQRYLLHSKITQLACLR